MPNTVQEFVERWKDSGGSERANFQRFAVELTQLLGVEEPTLATSDDQNDDYRFERPVDFGPTSMRSHGFIDLYRKGCFILWAKQGAAGKAGSGTNQLPATDNTPRQARTGHGVRGTRRWDDTIVFGAWVLAGSLCPVCGTFLPFVGAIQSE